VIRTGILPEERLGAHHWTTAEERLLRTLYPAGGTRAVTAQLPRRTKRAIKQRAYQLGISRKASA
jgi:hypothetical protein